MPDLVKQLDEWMEEKEGENLEFKEAKNRYDFEELAKYCAALANEGGGKIILGVSDERPRKVVGSKAFPQPERTRSGLNQRLHLGIDFDVIQHPDGRVLVFHVPKRPAGVVIQYDERFLVREGDSLVGMSSDRLREIHAEAGHDFSADFCSDLTQEDLDDKAIEEFRRRWIAKTGNRSIRSLMIEQVLTDIEVRLDDEITYAALILFGKREALRKHLAQAELVYEYRATDASGPAQARHEFQAGFFLWYERLWELINQRNDFEHYQDGMFVLDVPTFHERSIREAILNAVSHRNYQLGGSIFVRQYPKRIEIVSPGGLPVEVKLETILYRQSPRNRRIADVFTKCGLVERSGQGMNLIFELAIQHSNSLPDFQGTDEHQVSITLHGVMHNQAFVRFIRAVDEEVTSTFSTDDWLILYYLSRERPLPDNLTSRVERLMDEGLVVRAGQGMYILSQLYYRFLGREDTYARLREKEELKEILEDDIAEHAVDGSPLRELDALLPGQKRERVRALLEELRKEERIHLRGKKRWARWYPGPEPDS